MSVYLSNFHEHHIGRHNVERPGFRQCVEKAVGHISEYIIALVLGYPYHLWYGPIDLGVVDLIRVGQLLIYLSLVFSVASAAQYFRLFGAAVEATQKKRQDAAHS